MPKGIGVMDRQFDVQFDERQFVGMNDRLPAHELPMGVFSLLDNVLVADNKLVKRPGNSGSTAIAGSLAMLGGTAFERSNGSKSQIILLNGASNAQLYESTNGSTFTAIGSANITKDLQMNFVIASDRVFGFNGTDVVDYDGTTVTKNRTTVPIGKFGFYFHNYLFVAGTSANPNRVFWSDLGTPTAFTAANYIDVNANEGDCYDEETEILTDKGWKRFYELDKTENVMTLNPETRELEWQKPSRYVDLNYEGKMVYLHSKTTDLLVTPNHKFFIEDKTFLKGRFIEAKNLKKYSGRIPRNGKWNGTAKDSFFGIPVEKFMKFMGIWLSEGWVNGSGGERNVKSGYAMVISQKKINTKNEIRELFDDFPVKFYEYGDQFKGNNKDLWEYLSKLGGQAIRYIPEEIKNLPVKDLSILCEWMIKGDGHIENNPSGTTRAFYYTTSQRLANDFQEILLKIGKSGNIYIKKQKPSFINGRVVYPNLDIYQISIIKSKNAVLGDQRESYLYEADYKGKIFCVEVPNHIVYVRRRGKPLFSGNSITALSSFANAGSDDQLLVFKNNSLWSIKGFSGSTFSSTTIAGQNTGSINFGFGTPSHKSVLPVGKNVYYLSFVGGVPHIRMLERSLYGVLLDAGIVSFEMEATMKGLNLNQLAKVAGVFDGKYCYWALPNGSSTTNNLVIQLWHDKIYNTQQGPMRSWVKHTSGYTPDTFFQSTISGRSKLYWADASTSGKVFLVDGSVSTDNGVAIVSEIRPRDFMGDPVRKTKYKYLVLKFDTSSAGTLKVNARLDQANTFTLQRSISLAGMSPGLGTFALGTSVLGGAATNRYFVTLAQMTGVLLGAQLKESTSNSLTIYDIQVLGNRKGLRNVF